MKPLTQDQINNILLVIDSIDVFKTFYASVFKQELKAKIRKLK